jgi:thiol-disulfide isomerase/thioredoxin
VVDENGKPVAGAEVMVDPYSDKQSLTDKQGRFRIEELPKGEHHVRVSLGNAWLGRTIEAGRTDVELVLKAAPKASGAEPEAKASVSLKGKAAPGFEASHWVNSKALTLPALRGKIVVVDFWAIWCGPCLRELPKVQRLADKYKGRPVAVIGLHDSTTWPKELAAFAKKHKMTYPLAIDKTPPGRGSFGRTSDRYGVRGIPSVFVIDGSGRVVGANVSLEEADRIVAGLLAQAARKG